MKRDLLWSPWQHALSLASLVALVMLEVQHGNAITSQGTATMQVDATVQATCRVATAPIAFGPYRGVQIDIIGSVTVTCSNAASYYVNLNDGLYQGAGFQTRMAGPNAERLTYTLYTDAARVGRWGNTVNFDGVAGTGTGGAQILNIYARLFAGQLVGPGAYTDTIVATVSF